MVALAAARAGTYFKALAPVTAHIQKLAVEAGEVIHRGALVGMIPGQGGIQPLADTASMVFVGIALESKNNTSGADGALECEVYTGPALIRLATALGWTIANLGTNVYAADDQTFTDAATATNDVLIGRFMELDGSNFWIRCNGSAI